MKTLWIFGHSHSLPFLLKNEHDGWPTILAKKLNVQCINFSEPGADNFYIYSSFLKNRCNIDNEDIVIIGWSHYSRKSFVLDRSNSAQVSVIKNSLLYNKLENTEFIRSKPNFFSLPMSWLSLKPKNRGISYYDSWFTDYYSMYEQKINFQSYLDSVKLYLSGTQYLPFYFSQESVENIDITVPHAGFCTEFIVDAQLQISSNDMHFSSYGHQVWANHLLDKLTNLNNL